MFKSEVIGNKVVVSIELETDQEGAKRLLDLYFDSSAIKPLIVDTNDAIQRYIASSIEKGRNKLKTVMELKQVFGLSLKEAKDLCDPFPFPRI